MVRKYFGTDGIRGKANAYPMTPDIAMKVGMAVGLAFTPWALTTPSVLSIACALVGGMLALAAVLRRRRFSWPAMVGWGVLYAGFVVYVSFFG